MERPHAGAFELKNQVDIFAGGFAIAFGPLRDREVISSFATGLIENTGIEGDFLQQFLSGLHGTVAEKADPFADKGPPLHRRIGEHICRICIPFRSLPKRFFLEACVCNGKSGQAGKGMAGIFFGKIRQVDEGFRLREGFLNRLLFLDFPVLVALNPDHKQCANRDPTENPRTILFPEIIETFFHIGIRRKLSLGVEVVGIKGFFRFLLLFAHGDLRGYERKRKRDRGKKVNAFSGVGKTWTFHRLHRCQVALRPPQ